MCTTDFTSQVNQELVESSNDDKIGPAIIPKLAQNSDAEESYTIPTIPAENIEMNDEDHVNHGLCSPETYSFFGESKGVALDAVVVLPIPSSTNASSQESKDGFVCQGIVASSDFIVQFPARPSPQLNFQVLLQINGTTLDPSFLGMALPRANGEKEKQLCIFKEGGSTKPPTKTFDKLIEKNILLPGRNSIRYVLVERRPPQFRHQSVKKYLPVDTAQAFVYLWSVHDKIIIADIDGTVTKSDVRGVISSVVTENYKHVHAGVCAFFSGLVNNEKTEHVSSEDAKHSKKNQLKENVRVVYLSSRPISLMNSTRKFLSQLSQLSSTTENDISKNDEPIEIMKCMNLSNSLDNNLNNESVSDFKSRNNNTKAESKRLPPGPIFLHPGTVSTVLVTELVKKSTHEYKADVLTRQVVLPFAAAGKAKLSSSNIFLAGFGNKKTDAMAYEMAGVCRQDIYIIDKSSKLVSTKVDLDQSDDTGETVGCFNFKGVRNGIAFKTYDGYNDPHLTTAVMKKLYAHS